MPPAHFLPKKSSAHRIACIALYRALLNQCSRITLPPEFFARGKVNPIKHLIRKKFKQHVDVASHAQVVRVLKTGYIYENLLRHAANDDTASKSQLFSILTTLLDEAKIAAAAPRNPPKKALLHRPPRPVATPGAPKVLDIRPMPLSEIKGGRRHVPTILVHNNAPLAVLKLGKKLPEYVSRVFRQKSEHWQRLRNRIELLQDLQNEVEWEEEWEELVMNVAERENKVKATESEIWGSWNNALWVGMSDTKKALSLLIDDGTATAERMMDIVEQEREMALQERKMRKHFKNEMKWELKGKRRTLEGGEIKVDLQDTGNGAVGSREDHGEVEQTPIVKDTISSIEGDNRKGG